MVVAAERYVVLAQEVEYCLFSCHICIFSRQRYRHLLVKP
jgi:hypothetical protein